MFIQLFSSIKPKKIKNTTPLQQVRADGMSDAMAKYNDITNKIPPVLTAAAVPVVALSLLCKTVTGHGLPGDILGAIEGVSWLVLPLGAGSLLPRLGDIGSAGDIGGVIKAGLNTSGEFSLPNPQL
jgi:hypothetical protein